MRDPDRRGRLQQLEEDLLSARSVLNVDCLLDSIQALVADSDHPAIKRIKNIDSFLNRSVLDICQDPRRSGIQYPQDPRSRILMDLGSWVVILSKNLVDPGSCPLSFYGTLQVFDLRKIAARS